MPKKRVVHAAIPLVQLVWPLLVENILRTSLMSVDTLMLARYSEKAVAAMSLVHQFSFFILLIYLTVAIGSSILISQHLGAGDPEKAGLVAAGSLVLTTGFAVVLSALVVVFTGPIISLYRLDPEVALYATQFLQIFGGLSFFMALNIAQASILRTWGYPRDSMWINAFCLLVAVLGNALVLFGPFGFPVLGMVGVALSNVVSQLVACFIYHRVIRRRPEISLPLHRLAALPRSIYRSILAVGIPTAGENLAYNVSQIVIYSMVALMGTDALAAVGIVMACLRFVFMPGISIGQGAQLKVGYWVGAGLHDQAKFWVYRYFLVGLGISGTLVLLVFGLQRPLLGLFTHEQKIIELAASVLVVAVIHEPGRNFNTIIIPALKGAGDIHFPVLVGMASMWGIGVVGAWFLGLHCGLGLLGIWLAMAADEWVRGLAMLLRWRSQAWKRHTLVPFGELAGLSPTMTPGDIR